MAIHDIESRLLELEVGVDVYKGKIAAFHLMLVMERHDGGVICRRKVAGVVVAINAHLHMQHLCHQEFQVNI